MDKGYIESLKEKVSILDVISSRIKLRRSGKDWFGLCPFHKEKTGSFKVDPESGYYYCFGCGAHGDAITFLQQLERISFSEAVEQLARQYGVALPEKNVKRTYIDPNKIVYDANEEIKKWFAFQLREEIGKHALEYLKQRKISDESIEKFHLGFAPNNTELQSYLNKKGFGNDVLLRTGAFNKSHYGNRLINRYNSRLIFPILDATHRCVGFGGRILEKSNIAKYINSPESEIFVKSKVLYGYSVAKKSLARSIVLTEGYLDVISMHQAGLTGAVAPLGTTLSEDQINLCWKVCDTPIVSLDGDVAGVNASYRWIDKILPILQPGKSFKFAKLPQGVDPDILISEGRVDVIHETLKNAVPLSDWIWQGAFELFASETPEQKASIVRMLIEKVDTIKDPFIRELYTKMLKQKERGLYSKKKSFVKNENIQPVTSIRKKFEKIFVVTILNHPYIIDNVLENFVNIECEDIEVQKLKKKILDTYEACVSDTERFVAAIENIRLDNIGIDHDIVLHAKFAGQNVSDEEASCGWIQLWDRYVSMPSIAADLQKATSSLKSSFSEVDWQRLKALKKESVSNRGKQ